MLGMPWMEWKYLFCQNFSISLSEKVLSLIVTKSVRMASPSYLILIQLGNERTKNSHLNGYVSMTFILFFSCDMWSASCRCYPPTPVSRKTPSSKRTTPLPLPWAGGLRRGTPVSCLKWCPSTTCPKVPRTTCAPARITTHPGTWKGRGPWAPCLCRRGCRSPEVPHPILCPPPSPTTRWKRSRKGRIRPASRQVKKNVFFFYLQLANKFVNFAICRQTCKFCKLQTYFSTWQVANLCVNFAKDEPIF